MSLWWLSFCKSDDGSFLGACVVPGVDMVAGVPFPDEFADKVRDKFPHLIGRLMNRKEAEAFEGTIGVN